MHHERSRILDTFYLVGAAILLCVLGAGAFIVADVYHVSPLWVIVSLISVGFFAGAREDYRREFRSPRFVAFVCGWVVINVVVFITFLVLFGWVWLIPALVLEQILFYMSAFWFFDVPPPSKRWPFQRASSDKNEE
jgi:hypothetical protein